MNIITTHLIIFALCLGGAKWETGALPQGAPASACNSLMPFHGGGIPPQPLAPPYRVGLLDSTMRVAQGSRIVVVVGNPQGNNFQGFMMQARIPNSFQTIGQFVQVPSPGAKAIKCTRDDDTVTHDSTTPKRELRFEWQAPSDYIGPMVFNYTIAQDYSTFWVGYVTQQYEIVEQSDLPSSGQSSSTSFVPSRSTTPNFEPETESPSTGGQVNNPFYNGCNELKGCFGVPDGCIGNKKCKAAVATIVKGERYEFEMLAVPEATYVAVGLSNDNKMGDDSIIECVREGNSFKAFMAYTKVGPYDSIRLRNPNAGITLLNASATETGIYCRVQRDVKTMVQDKEYDLINGKFHLLVAAGSNAESHKIHFHDVAYASTEERKPLADVSGYKASSKLLLRLHGAFMIAAWIGTASLGILLARYFRMTWVGSQLCGKDMWFAWHRFFMILTWSLTMVGFVIIFVHLQGWSGEKNPHAILGTVTTVICFLQPIGAYFRPHPGTSRRSLFNWVHWLGGNVAHILAIVTIFFAVKLNKAELPEWMDWVLVAFVAFHVIMHLLLSILSCCSDKSSSGRVTSFPMKDLAGGRNLVNVDRKMDAPKSGLRKFLLAFYILGLIVLVVALIVIVVLAPIEESWESFRKELKTSMNQT